MQTTLTQRYEKRTCYIHFAWLHFAKCKIYCEGLYPCYTSSVVSWLLNKNIVCLVWPLLSWVTQLPVECTQFIIFGAHLPEHPLFWSPFPPQPSLSLIHLGWYEHCLYNNISGSSSSSWFSLTSRPAGISMLRMNARVRCKSSLLPCSFLSSIVGRSQVWSLSAWNLGHRCGMWRVSWGPLLHSQSGVSPIFSLEWRWCLSLVCPHLNLKIVTWSALIMTSDYM